MLSLIIIMSLKEQVLLSYIIYVIIPSTDENLIRYSRYIIDYNIIYQTNNNSNEFLLNNIWVGIGYIFVSLE